MSKHPGRVLDPAREEIFSRHGKDTNFEHTQLYSTGWMVNRTLNTYKSTIVICIVASFVDTCYSFRIVVCAGTHLSPADIYAYCEGLLGVNLAGSDENPYYF